jgi:hypothetical protein
VGVLLVKRMWERFPVFVTYSLSNFVIGASLYAGFMTQLPHNLYSSLYWLNEALGLALGLGLVYEIFRHLIDPYPGLRKLASLVFCMAIVLLLLVGCILASSQPSLEPHPLTKSFLIIVEAARILEVGLLFFLFLFASVFGLHWRQYVFGMGLGLGFFTAVELVRVSLRVHFGITHLPALDMVRTVSFNAGLLIWIGYMLAPELASDAAEVPKRSQLEQWNRAIMELIYQ